MADIPQQTGQQGAGSQRAALAAEQLAEDPAQPQHDESDDVIQQDNRGRRGRAYADAVADRTHARGQLQQAVSRRGEQPPAGAVPIGDDEDGQHTAGRDAAAIGQIHDLDQAEHGGECQHDGAFGQPDRRHTGGCAFLHEKTSLCSHSPSHAGRKKPLHGSGGAA